MTLADWLIEHGISQADFASRIESSQPTVSRYVTGLRMPRKDHLRKIREVTRGAVTADDFVSEMEAAE